MNRNECLEKAKEIINGQRQQDYGKPEDNIGTISEMWTDYVGKTIDIVDVCMMMAQLKIARVRSGHATEDSFIDICGYAALGAEMYARLHE